MVGDHGGVEGQSQYFNDPLTIWTYVVIAQFASSHVESRRILQRKKKRFGGFMFYTVMKFFFPNMGYFCIYYLIYLQCFVITLKFYVSIVPVSILGYFFFKRFGTILSQSWL